MKRQQALMIFRFLTVLLTFFWFARVHASALELPLEEEFTITDQIWYLEDSEAKLTYHTLPALGTGWSQNPAQNFNQGYSSSAWWLDLRIHNPHHQMQTRYLDLAYAVLDYIDIYIYSGERLKAEFHTGDRRRFHSRPIDSNTFVIPLTWEADETLRITYRIKSGSSIQAPLRLWIPETFFARDSYTNIVQGFFFGSTLIFVIYNLMIFFILGDKSYFYYASFILCLPLFFLALGGQGYRYIWTDHIELNSHAIPLFLGLSFLFAGLFTRRFLNLRVQSLLTDILVSTFALLGGGCALLSLVIPYHVVIIALVPIGLCACFADLFAGILAWIRNLPSARYYLIAWISFLIGSICFAFSKLGLMPATFLTEHAIQFGSMLQAVLLSLALANSINVERKLRFKAQEESLSTTRRLNEELEKRVQERTLELESLNQRLQVLSNTDELTGLKNRRFITEALSEEWIRCRRYQHPLSVMLMDIDFFKKVNDSHGHHAGDQCLVEIAGLIHDSLRIPTDQVARYGGEEFLVMLPETTAEGARAVANRVRANIEKHVIKVDTTRFQVTVSIGLYTCSAEADDSVDHILKRADIALYQSKEQGRNQVTIFNRLQGP